MMDKLLEEIKQESTGATPWFELVSQFRKEVNPFYVIINSWKSPDLTFRQKLGRIYTQYILSKREVKAIYKEVKKYGSVTKREYNTSKVRQFIQQLYLFFVLGVRSKYYRRYHLFKETRWQHVKKFTFRHHEVQLLLIMSSFPEEKEILENKFRFNDHCRKHSINSPEIIAVYSRNKEILNGSNGYILPKSDIFIKEKQGALGQGAARFNFDGLKYSDSNNNIYSADELAGYFTSNSQTENDFIVQPVVKNHEDWAGFTTGALATCRIVTARISSGDIILLVATLRMPSGSSITDNFDTGGIASPVNLKTGELGMGISMQPKNARFEFDRHPDTNQKINGSYVPHWSELVEFTINVHETFRTIFVGWDISYTTHGFTVLEGNITWTPGVIESPHCRPLVDTSYPALFEKWIKTHTIKPDFDIPVD